MLRRRAVPWIRWSCVAPILLAGCGGAVLEPRYDEGRQAYVVEERIDDLVQTLEFSHARPAPGDTLWIRSVVVNHGAARYVAAHMCGLDLETDLQLGGDFIQCAAPTTSGPLASGDSLWSATVGVIDSRPGVYRMRIRQLLEPEHWIAVDIEVARP